MEGHINNINNDYRDQTRVEGGVILEKNGLSSLCNKMHSFI